MPVTMPKIEVTFQQQAGSLMERSERGYAILIVKDNTNPSWDYREYTDLTALEEHKDDYTAANYAAITDILSFAPYRVFVFRIDAEENTIDAFSDSESEEEIETPPAGKTLSDALALVTKKVKTGWVTVADMTTADATALSGWIQAQEKLYKSYKAVVYQPTVAPDSMRVVNFGNESVTFTDERGKQSGTAYLPSLIGIFAVCNVTRGCTNYHCSNLSTVEEVSDNTAALKDGKFILVLDDDGKVRVAQGNNSMTTTNGKTRTEDMQYIETVEAMDLIRDDIVKTFRETYLGNYRNTLDNQMLFISSLNFSYFQKLAQQGILDPNYTNVASIDASAQRLAWQASGKTEAADWDDAKVKATPFKRSVYLKADIKIAGSMTDLLFAITMA